MSSKASSIEQSLPFKVTATPLAPTEAVKIADEVEAEIGAIANGSLKPGKLKIVPIVKLIQFTRDTARVNVSNKATVAVDLLKALQAIADYPANANSDPDVMAKALQNIEAIACEAINQAKELHGLTLSPSQTETEKAQMLTPHTPTEADSLPLPDLGAYRKQQR